MKSEIKVGEQVLVRRSTRNGTQIRIGTVLAMRDGERALVRFPADSTQAVLPLAELELTRHRFSGRARVQIDPTLRRAL